MKKKIFLLIVAALLVLIGSGIIYFKHRITPPSAAALKSLAAAEKRPSGYYFPGESDKPLIIVYPGALIDVRGYSVWASALAREGYPVYLIEMPLEFSFFASSKADQALAEIKPQTYIIGGHSAGGAAASRFAAQKIKKHDQRLRGIFFMASYAIGGKTLSSSTIPALSLTGSLDRDIPDKSVREKKTAFPKNTEFQTITGGVHLGFASTTKGSPGAEITNAEQNTLVAQEMLAWLVQSKIQ